MTAEEYHQFDQQERELKHALAVPEAALVEQELVDEKQTLCKLHDAESTELMKMQDAKTGKYQTAMSDCPPVDVHRALLLSKYVSKAPLYLKKQEQVQHS